MRTPKVSIIVPIYKVEKEMDRCIKSILNQTYSNLEIILVNDGSPDKCPEMCNDYAEIDRRIKVIHKRNGGLSDARNEGLKIATGDYISFIDSDDWVADVFIECLLGSLIETNSDIAICNYYLVNEKGQKFKHKMVKEIEVLNHEEGISTLFAQQKFGCMVCTKLYKKNLFNNLEFPKGKLYEDIAISLPIFDRAKQSVLINKELYYYFQHENSIVNSGFNIHKLDMLKYTMKMISYSHNHGHKYDVEAETFYLKSLMMILLQIYQDNSSKKEKNIVRYLKKELISHKKYIWKNKYIEPRRQFVMYLMIYNFPIKLLVILWKRRMQKKYEK